MPILAGGSENCTDNDVRLLGGNDEREGVVQICYKGVWGTVCDSQYAITWNDNSANVVCRQLGFLELNQSNISSIKIVVYCRKHDKHYLCHKSYDFFGRCSQV